MIQFEASVHFYPDYLKNLLEPENIDDSSESECSDVEELRTPIEFVQYHLEELIYLMKAAPLCQSHSIAGTPLISFLTDFHSTLVNKSSSFFSSNIAFIPKSIAENYLLQKLIYFNKTLF